MILTDKVSYKQVEPGLYPARLIRIIDLGTQETTFEGKTSKRHQVLVTFELTNEIMDGGDHDGMPYLISRFYSASLNKKSSLRKDIESWCGRLSEHEAKSFPFETMLGKTAYLNIIHGDNGKAKITAILPLPKGLTITENVNDLVHYEIADREGGSFSELSEGIRAIIRKSEEFKRSKETVDLPADAYSNPLECITEPENF